MKRKILAFTVCVLLLTCVICNPAFAVIDTFLGGNVNLSALVDTTHAWGSMSYDNAAHQGTVYTTHIKLTYRVKTMPTVYQDFTSSINCQDGTASTSIERPFGSQSSVYSYSYGTVNQLGNIWSGTTGRAYP